jgi:hypothetical protein
MLFKIMIKFSHKIKINLNENSKVNSVWKQKYIKANEVNKKTKKYLKNVIYWEKWMNHEFLLIIECFSH